MMLRWPFMHLGSSGDGDGGGGEGDCGVGGGCEDGDGDTIFAERNAPLPKKGNSLTRVIHFL